MLESYSQTIARLIEEAPFGIDTEVQFQGRPPTAASSEFLTNKEQGDWAERVVFHAINENLPEYVALQYGRADSLAAGEEGFSNFYLSYQDELNRIGKKPDLLIFRRADLANTDLLEIDLDDTEIVRKAVAAIEVRSSSFLANQYAAYMNGRLQEANQECRRIRQIILQEPFASVLQEKSPALFKMIEEANDDTFRKLSFRLPKKFPSPISIELANHLLSLRKQIEILRKRDYLSITPKLEDLALVNRWIQNFGVKHYYLQVFFDKAYIISFQEILEISSAPKQEGLTFSIEKDSKNQRKTTIKIDVRVGREILGKIDMPQYKAALKELGRGRLLFYVTFEGGRGYLNPTVFSEEIINDI